jgi:hypothetical protein
MLWDLRRPEFRRDLRAIYHRIMELPDAARAWITVRLGLFTLVLIPVTIAVWPMFTVWELRRDYRRRQHEEMV